MTLDVLQEDISGPGDVDNDRPTKRPRSGEDASVRRSLLGEPRLQLPLAMPPTGTAGVVESATSHPVQALLPSALPYTVRHAASPVVAQSSQTNVQHTISRNDSYDISHDGRHIVQQNAQHNVSQNSRPNISNNAPRNVQRHVQHVPSRVPQNVSQNVLHDVSQTILHNIPQGVSHNVLPHGMPHNTS